jgi:hypothetical protein
MVTMFVYQGTLIHSDITVITPCEVVGSRKSPVRFENYYYNNQQVLVLNVHARRCVCTHRSI